MAPPLPTEANAVESELANRRQILRQSRDNGDYLDISDIGADELMETENNQRFTDKNQPTTKLSDYVENRANVTGVPPSSADTNDNKLGLPTQGQTGRSKSRYTL